MKSVSKLIRKVQKIQKDFLPVISLPQPTIVKLIQGEWYNQRFDGCPLFLTAITEAELRREKRKPSGTEADVRVCFFFNGKADYFHRQSDIARGARAVIKQAKSNPAYPAKLLDAWKQDEQAFDRYFSQFDARALRTISDVELSKVWKKYFNLAIRRFTSSSIIDHFALGTDVLVRTKLHQEVDSQVKGHTVSSSKFIDIFSVATAPVHQSFINLAEIDLLKIRLGLSRETAKQYQQRYFWINNNYVNAQVLSVKYFQQHIVAWKKSRKNLLLEIKKIEQTPSINAKKKKALMARYHISKGLQTLLKISEDFTWWQDERKKATLINIHMGNEILNEIARRKKYKVDELKYAVPSELVKIIHQHGPSRKVLRARKKFSVYVATRQGYYFVSGTTAKTVEKIMFTEKQFDQVQDIRGLSACLGRAIGRVKVVGSATEIGKVKQGDILVAVMTRPDYVPAMKKAAAIVTNEGGITSHAAIVSRELGIPCIIGTKIATQIFHDGDLVEVDANHGWVRKVQS